MVKILQVKETPNGIELEKLWPWKKFSAQLKNCGEKEAIKIGINFNTVKLTNFLFWKLWYH